MGEGERKEERESTLSVVLRFLVNEIVCQMKRKARKGNNLNRLNSATTLSWQSFCLPPFPLSPAQRKRKCVAVQDFKIEFRVAFCVILKNRPQNHFKATWKWHFELIPTGRLPLRLTVCAFPFPFSICLISLPSLSSPPCVHLATLATNLLIYSLRKGCLIRFDDVFIYLPSK